MVAISSIDQQTFRQLVSAATASQIALGVEAEWFADRDVSILGAVGFGGRFKGWGYTMLKRDTPDGFRVCVRHEHFASRHTARIMLLRQMAGAETVQAEPLAA
jgi:nicotinamide mononucleotide (NMN) deamidase PncC